MFESLKERLDRAELSPFPSAMEFMRETVNFKNSEIFVPALPAMTLLGGMTSFALGTPVAWMFPATIGLTGALAVGTSAVMTVGSAAYDVYKKCKKTTYVNKAGQRVKSTIEHKQKLEYAEKTLYAAISMKKSRNIFAKDDNKAAKNLAASFRVAHKIAKKVEILDAGSKNASPSEYQYCVSGHQASFRQGYQKALAA